MNYHGFEQGECVYQIVEDELEEEGIDKELRKRMRWASNVINEKR